MNFFKTHYSIGKSVLTLETEGERSVFEVAKNLGLKEIFLLEDSMTGFAEAYFNAEKVGIPIRFGVLLTHGEDKDNLFKFGAVARNTEGYKSLVKMYSFQETKKEKWLTSEEIKELWTEDLWMVIPFYDSFLFKNYLEGKSCIFDVSIKPVLAIEDNDLPFDGILTKKVEELAESEGLETLNVQSCFYPNPDWFDAWQTVKTMNKRSYNGGDLGRPNLDHCGSDNFYAK